MKFQAKLESKDLQIKALKSQLSVLTRKLEEEKLARRRHQIESIKHSQIVCVLEEELVETKQTVASLSKAVSQYQSQSKDNQRNI